VFDEQAVKQLKLAANLRSITFSSSLLSLVDCFLVATAPVCVSMSPTGDFLATAHVDSLGIYLWSEQLVVSDDITVVFLSPLSANHSAALFPQDQ